MGGFGAVLGSPKSGQTKVFCCTLVLIFSSLRLIFVIFAAYTCHSRGKQQGLYSAVSLLTDK